MHVALVMRDPVTGWTGVVSPHNAAVFCRTFELSDFLENTLRSPGPELIDI
jgi:hypothetical protein